MDPKMTNIEEIKNISFAQGRVLGGLEAASQCATNEDDIPSTTCMESIIEDIQDNLRTLIDLTDKALSGVPTLPLRGLGAVTVHLTAKGRNLGRQMESLEKGSADAGHAEKKAFHDFALSQPATSGTDGGTSPGETGDLKKPRPERDKNTFLPDPSWIQINIDFSGCLTVDECMELIAEKYDMYVSDVYEKLLYHGAHASDFRRPFCAVKHSTAAKLRKLGIPENLFHELGAGRRKARVAQ